MRISSVSSYASATMRFIFELKLPNGATAQILDVMDFISNNLLMPLVALLSCILIGWVVKPQVIIDEVTLEDISSVERGCISSW